MKLALAIIFWSLLYGCTPCPAMDSERAVQAVIGEAAGQTFAEKLAVACALRNRGTLAGVRGIRNQRMIQSEPPRIWIDAREAWAQSATNDVTHGATHWESDQFPAPAWSRGMTLTAHIGKFKFFKP